MRAVREGRRLLARALDDAGLPGGNPGRSVRDDALLILSELLSNAVQACREDVAVSIEVHRTWLGLAVRDDSPSPAVRRRPGPQEIHGRGVDIVAVLSSDWGQTSWDGSGKTVWSRLELPAEAMLVIDCREA